MLYHTRGSRPANLTLLSLATIAALAFASCADGVDDYAQDKNEDGTIGSDVPGSNGSGNNNSGNNNSGNKGDDNGSGNKGDDNGSGNTSPNKPGSKCQETLRRCNDKGNVEVCTGGVYVEDPCDGTCFKGECTEFNDNSCENPLVVAPGDKKSLSTNTRNDFAVSNTYSACKNIHNRLAVAKLTIPKFGYYEITVTSAQDVPNWGVFESLSCTADDFYQNSCLSTGEQKSRTMTRLLSPDDFYVFVGGINAKTAPPPFDATIELKQLDAPKAVACNYKGKVTPVDATKGSYTDKNKTSTGVTQAKGDNGGKCSNASTGKEIAYAFQLTQTKTVVAKIQITRENGEPCGANIEDKCPTPSLHIQKCADESALSARNNTVECAVLAESTNSLALEKQIPPGEYLLFVDSDSTSNSYAYDLTLTFK